MEPQESTFDAAAALEQLDWVRGLARSLVRDASLADDIAQETWLATLRRPASSGAASKGWLARVVRNAVRQENRREAIRSEHEERARQRREAEATDELVDRVHTQRMVVDAVLALDAPYQRVVLFRYFEGLTPREIAQRQGIPVATVKTRLRRALAQLREALDARNGGERHSWLPAVAAIGAPTEKALGVSAVAIGGIAMGTLMKISAAVLVVTAGLYFVTRTPAIEPAPAAAVVLATDRATLPETVELADAPTTERVEGEATGRAPIPATRPSTEAAPAQRHLLRVIVDGLAEEEARLATISVSSLFPGRGIPGDVHDSWAGSGRTTELDLDPFLARLGARAGELRGDEIDVIIDHPFRFSETVRLSLEGGREEPEHTTVFEVHVRFADVVYWPELALSVRDANTRAHLEDIELRCVPTAFMGMGQVPFEESPVTRIGEGLSSPITLMGGRKSTEREDWMAGLALSAASGEAPRPAELVQPEDNRRGVVLYARAPGYGWGRIVLDVSTGAGRELLLRPGAALDVRLTNVQREAYAALEKEASLIIVRSGDDAEDTRVWSQTIDDALAVDGLRLEGLESGEHVVSVELGGWSRKPFVLAREELSLGAGEARELVLALPDAPEPPARASLAGWLSFPIPSPTWDDDAVRIELFASDYEYGEPDAQLALSEMQRVSGGLPTWSFRLEDLPAGIYQVRLVPFLKSWMIELPAGGLEDVRLELPELAEVLVETIDERTGERVPLEEIRYGTLNELPGRVRRDWSTVDRTATNFEGEPGRFRFWIEPGTAYVQTYGVPSELNYGERRKEMEVSPGRQTVQLELAPAGMLRFEFHVDGAPLPWDDAIFVGLGRGIRAVEHQGTVSVMTYWLFEASEPGLYEITFEGIGTDRFLPIERRTVDVRAGETTDVIVELRRK